MCQTSNLRIKSQPGLTLLLGNFHLTFFILSDILHSYSLAERIKHIVLCFMYHSGNVTNTFLDSRGLCLCLSTTTEVSVFFSWMVYARQTFLSSGAFNLRSCSSCRNSSLMPLKRNLQAVYQIKSTIWSELTKTTAHTRSSRETVSVDSEREISAKRFSSVFIRGLCFPSSFNWLIKPSRIRMRPMMKRSQRFNLVQWTKACHLTLHILLIPLFIRTMRTPPTSDQPALMNNRSFQRHRYITLSTSKSSPVTINTHTFHFLTLLITDISRHLHWITNQSISTRMVYSPLYRRFVLHHIYS